MSTLRPTVCEDWLVGNPTPPAWQNKASACDDGTDTCASGTLTMAQGQRIQGVTLSGFPAGTGGVLKLDYQVLSVDGGRAAESAFVAYAALDGTTWGPFVFDDAAGEVKTASLQLAAGQDVSALKVRFGNVLVPAGLAAEGHIYTAVFDCRVEPSGSVVSGTSGKKAACNAI